MDLRKMMHHHGFAAIHSERLEEAQPPKASFDAVDGTAFRNGMSRLGSAVSVVTTLSGGHRYGFTASAVCSVSVAPPTLLFCINRASSTFGAFEGTRFFCVNTLMPGQEAISEAFGGKTPTAGRFAFGTWREGLTGVPMLEGASVSIECEVTNFVDEATHRVVFGRAVGITENEERAALLYHMRRYLSA